MKILFKQRSYAFQTPIPFAQPGTRPRSCACPRSKNAGVLMHVTLQSSPRTMFAAVLAAAHLQSALFNIAPVYGTSITPEQQMFQNVPSLTAIATSETQISEEVNNATEIKESTGEPSANSKTEKERDLEALTRRNTHVSGRASQQFTKARRFAGQGDFDRALDTYNELVNLAPTFAPGFSNRANILVAKGRLDEAIKDYSRALDLAPRDGDTWVLFLNRGTTRLAAGDDPRSVLEDFNAAYARKGADPLVLANRGAAFEALGKWESAIRDYQNALKGNDVKPFWFRYALVLFQKGKSVEAKAILKRVINNFKVDDVRAAMAAIYYEDGDVATAETLWSEMDRPRQYESRAFLESRKWPPRAVEAMDKFRSLRQ